jgi:NADPH:quinone reductase-like Zn-dependent oxidoreductase
VRDLGAADVIDYETQDVAEAVRSVAPDGIDAVADMVGDKDAVSRLSELIRAGGRVASAAGGADPEALAARDIKAANVMTMTTTPLLDGIAAALADGRVRPPQIERAPLDRAGDAISRVGEHHVRGKIVILLS